MTSGSLGVISEAEPLLLIHEHHVFGFSYVTGTLGGSYGEHNTNALTPPASNHHTYVFLIQTHTWLAA